MAELCFNLWYYLDKNQFIAKIAAREYFLEGTDEEKSEILAELSKYDIKSLKPILCPKRSDANLVHLCTILSYGN